MKLCRKYIIMMKGSYMCFKVHVSHWKHISNTVILPPMFPMDLACHSAHQHQSSGWFRCVTCKSPHACVGQQFTRICNLLKSDTLQSFWPFWLLSQSHAKCLNWFWHQKSKQDLTDCYSWQTLQRWSPFLPRNLQAVHAVRMMEFGCSHHPFFFFFSFFGSEELVKASLVEVVALFGM